MSNHDDSYIPSSDADSIDIQGFSQRDETREEVEQLIHEQLATNDRIRERRQKRESEHTKGSPYLRPSALSAGRTNKEYFQPGAALDSQTDSQQWLRGQCSGQDVLHPAGDETDLDLLRLQLGNVEAERDKLQEERDHLRQECVNLRETLAQANISLKFFQKETGKWRWAAARGYTKIQAALNDLGMASTVLRHPDGEP
ncbi:hypothetical protein C8J57DRAFT_1535372 [Mycena rebaudengoi]|nr:hypothetical protein C8J57DRAFT_1535372 [Mycena rebaudengoi]